MVKHTHTVPSLLQTDSLDVFDNFMGSVSFRIKGLRSLILLFLNLSNRGFNEIAEYIHSCFLDIFQNSSGPMFPHFKGSVCVCVIHSVIVLFRFFNESHYQP